MIKEVQKLKNAMDDCCGGCRLHIRDRFFLLAADKPWHIQCLRCSKCFEALDSAFSCFARNGDIFCKTDYYRLFSENRCARCRTGLSSSELVMRARELVFHVDCFLCALCGVQLGAGDTAAVCGGKVLCGQHYDVVVLKHIEPNTTISSESELCPGRRLKGRPRKKKSSIGTTQHSKELSDMVERGCSTVFKMEVDHCGNSNCEVFDDINFEASHSPESNSSASSQRTKRMRTSFKHNQLRTMKSYFAINQNPDAKDLKQLAQKTALSKRVLQVWFQNARAKWRRNLMRQEGNHNQLAMHPDQTITRAFIMSQSNSRHSCSPLTIDDIPRTNFSELF